MMLNSCKKFSYLFLAEHELPALLQVQISFFNLLPNPDNPEILNIERLGTGTEDEITSCIFYGHKIYSIFLNCTLYFILYWKKKVNPVTLQNKIQVYSDIILEPK